MIFIQDERTSPSPSPLLTPLSSTLEPLVGYSRDALQHLWESKLLLVLLPLLVLGLLPFLVLSSSTTSLLTFFLGYLPITLCLLTASYRSSLNSLVTRVWTQPLRPLEDPSTLRIPGYHTMIKGLMTGPNEIENKLQSLAHLPCYLARFFHAFLFRLPVFLFRSALQYARTGQLAFNCTEEEIFKLLTHSSLVIATRLQVDEEGRRTLSFELPEDLAGRVHGEEHLSLSGFKLKLDPDTRRVLEATHWGKDISQDHELIICLIAAALQTWIHPALHVSAERACRVIEELKYEPLKPSSLFVLPLHDGLNNGPLSPFSDTIFFAVPMVLEDIYLRTDQPFPHLLQQEKSSFFYYDFMVKAHDALARLHHKHQIPASINLNDLFSNSILHGLDHQLKYDVLQHTSISMDGTRSLISYFRFWMYLVWLEPISNPLIPERLSQFAGSKDPSRRFYAELYEELAKHDPSRVLLNKIYVSTSF